MINYEDFISHKRSALIAPAGFGKTYTISQCLLLLKESGKQLILTHTHAGVASIKEKLKSNNISNSECSVETITSLCQRYVTSFTTKSIPDQEKTNEYYSFIIEEAKEIFNIKPIRDVFLNTYSGLFIDEYQDCSLAQHQLIDFLADYLPTRILGDPLQGIFEFNSSEMANMDDPILMKNFQNVYQLNSPQRWLRGNNDKLGNDLMSIRKKIIEKQKINLSEYKSIKTYIIPETKLHSSPIFYKEIYSLLGNKSLLLIHPNTVNVQPRIGIIQKFQNRLLLLEAIDDKDFYKIAVKLDKFDHSQVDTEVYNLLCQLFSKTSIKSWFNEKGFIKKMSLSDKEVSNQLKIVFDEYSKQKKPILLSNLIKKFQELLNLKCYRVELFNSICKALEDAQEQDISVYEAMINKRNQIRRFGRKVHGRCIGTTLLTKGLEFDQVVILNAHKITCAKNLYVAMTRACKKLIIFTESDVLTPLYK